MSSTPADIPVAAIREFCNRWGVKEFSLFGSFVAGTARPDSDVDIMLEFAPGHGFAFETMPVMLDELRAMFGREVDVVEKDCVTNRFRREAIFATRKVIHAA